MVSKVIIAFANKQSNNKALPIMRGETCGWNWNVEI